MQSSLLVEPTGRNIKAVDVAKSAKIVEVGPISEPNSAASPPAVKGERNEC